MKIKHKPICFVISSPSAAGKTTVVERILAEDKTLSKTISHTTRKMRPGEKDGVHYHFVNEQKFQQMEKSGQMLEWATVYDNMYGTSKKEIERILGAGSDVVLVIENEGALAIKKLFPRSVFILILPPSMEELKKRIMKREHGDDDVEQRLKNASAEIRSLIWYDYAVINENLEDSIKLFKDIISAERAKLPSVKEEILKNFLSGGHDA